MSQAASLAQLDFVFKPDLVLELSYSKAGRGKSWNDSVADVHRLFRYIAKRTGLEFYYSIHGGHQEARRGQVHFHVESRYEMVHPGAYRKWLQECAVPQDLPYLADSSMDSPEVHLPEMFAASWRAIIGHKPKQRGVRGPKDEPAIVRDAETYINHYRSKNPNLILCSDEQILGNKMGYNFNGHAWEEDGKVYFTACPRPRRGKCSHTGGCK